MTIFIAPKSQFFEVFTRLLSRKSASLLSLILLVSLQGCARLTLMTSKNVAAEIEQATANGDYNKAWYYLDNIRESNPQYEQVDALREKLAADTETFEKEKASEAQSLASSGRWCSGGSATTTRFAACWWPPWCWASWGTCCTSCRPGLRASWSR